MGEPEGSAGGPGELEEGEAVGSGLRTPDSGLHRRLFFAIALSDHVREKLSELVGSLKKGAVFTGSKPTWVLPENYHITLWFLGNVPQETADDLRARLAEAVRGIPPFKIDLRHIGYFPDERAPRVLWAGIFRPPPAMDELRLRAGRIIEAAGLTLPADAAHSPHVTLARFKSSRGVRAFVEMASQHRFIHIGGCTVDRLILMESLTGGGPARYVPFAEAPLLLG